MAKSRRTEAAQRDLESIAFEIALADRRPVTADRIIDELIGQCDKLAQLAPTAILGTSAPELARASDSFRSNAGSFYFVTLRTVSIYFALPTAARIT